MFSVSIFDAKGSTNHAPWIASSAEISFKWALKLMSRPGKTEKRANSIYTSELQLLERASKSGKSEIIGFVETIFC